MTTLKVIQEKWESIEKKNGHAEGNQYSFYERFLHEEFETIKSTLLPSTRKACGFTTLKEVNKPEFHTNDIENVNSQIKFWVNEKLPLDVFIQKMKDLIECQERQYIDAISGTGDFEFAEKFKYLETGSAWFLMVAKGTNNRHLQQELNTEASCGTPTLELKEITVTTLDVSSSDFPSFIFSDVAEYIIFLLNKFSIKRKYENRLTMTTNVKFHKNTHCIKLLWLLQKQDW